MLSILRWNDERIFVKVFRNIKNWTQIYNCIIWHVKLFCQIGKLPSYMRKSDFFVEEIFDFSQRYGRVTRCCGYNSPFAVLQTTLLHHPLLDLINTSVSPTWNFLLMRSRNYMKSLFVRKCCLITFHVLFLLSSWLNWH